MDIYIYRTAIKGAEKLITITKKFGALPLRIREHE
jgi:hypothetical protein